jgi:hypothetical protein
MGPWRLEIPHDPLHFPKAATRFSQDERRKWAHAVFAA